MTEQYDIFRVTKEMRSNPPIDIMHIERSTSDAIPEGALSLSGLRMAEEQRAANARQLMANAGAYSLFLQVSDTIAMTGLYDLLRSLESGSVVYERAQPADQSNGSEASSAFAHLEYK